MKKRIFVLLVVLVPLVGCAVLGDRVSVSSNFLPTSDSVTVVNAVDGPKEPLLVKILGGNLKEFVISTGQDKSFGVLVWRDIYSSSKPVSVIIKGFYSDAIWSDSIPFYYNQKRRCVLIVRRGTERWTFYVETKG